MNDTFAGYPKSISEIKSEQSRDAKDWTPRECLIDMLRRIDEGAEIDSLIVCFRQTVNGKRQGLYSQATKDGFVTLGLMSAVATKIYAGSNF